MEKPPQKTIQNKAQKPRQLIKKIRKLITSGIKEIDTSMFLYLGADDKAGPNYTGQEVVNSYYALKAVS